MTDIDRQEKSSESDCSREVLRIRNRLMVCASASSVAIAQLSASGRIMSASADEDLDEMDDDGLTEYVRHAVTDLMLANLELAQEQQGDKNRLTNCRDELNRQHCESVELRKQLAECASRLQVSGRAAILLALTAVLVVPVIVVAVSPRTGDALIQISGLIRSLFH